MLKHIYFSLVSVDTAEIFPKFSHTHIDTLIPPTLPLGAEAPLREPALQAVRVEHVAAVEAVDSLRRA